MMGMMIAFRDHHHDSSDLQCLGGEGWGFGPMAWALGGDGSTGRAGGGW
jgi:hypothetical protein